MPKTIHPANSRWFWVFVLLSFLVFPALGHSATTADPTLKIKRVKVVKSGDTLKVVPLKVQVHRKQEIVVWVTDGKSMKIEFKPGNPPPGNPFTDLTCPGGQFCGALTPPDVLGVFDYKVTVDGKVLDPKVEVLP
jgi:hypothetical protein